MNKDYAHTMQGDLISRQDALCILKKKMMDRPLDSDRWVIRDIAVEIKLLPSAEPKTGEWIMSEYQRDEDVANGNYLYNCSNCGHADVHVRTRDVPYCWYCGARMLGEDGEA